jgi:hypothetical protein
LRRQSGFECWVNMWFRMKWFKMKLHIYVHDFARSAISYNFYNPTTLSINHLIWLCIFGCKYVFKCQIESMHHTRCLKDIWILLFYDLSSHFSNRCIVCYNLNHMIRTDIFNCLSNQSSYFVLVLNHTLTIYSLQKHWRRVGHYHEINQKISFQHLSNYP